MRFLAVYPAGIVGGARKAKEGEPCVSNFRVCGPDKFVGLETDGMASNATPAEFPDGTLDKLYEEYVKRYPAIPPATLEKYFFASADAASRFKDGVRVKVAHVNGDITRFYSPETGTTMEVNLE